MPYIETAKVAEMRKAIKAALPDYKVSVRKRHHSSVDVTVLSGPLEIECDQLGKNRMNINLFWYKETLAHRPDIIAVVDKIVAAMDSIEQNRTMFEDGDYGNVPNYYRDVSFGQWDKHYQQTA